MRHLHRRTANGAEFIIVALILAAIFAAGCSGSQPTQTAGGAMENQTLSLLGRGFVTADPDGAVWGLTHESAHHGLGTV
jgi:hypothetical protein